MENNFFVNTIGLTLNYLGFGGLIITAMVAYQDRAIPRPMALLAKMGYFSYSIYLWHSAVAFLAARHLPARIGWTATLAIYLVGSVLLGILAAKLIELPFLRLRERLLPSRVPYRPV